MSRQGHAEGARFAAAAFVERHIRAHQLFTTLLRLIGLHRRVARVVIHVAHPSTPWSLTSLLHQVLVDVEQPAAGENLVELVFLQLVHAGAARHDHRLDVEIVQRVRDAMEQHAVVGGDLVGLVALPGGILRIAAAQIARRQHGDRAGLIQHRLRRQARPGRTSAPSRSPGSRTPLRCLRSIYAGCE